MATVRDQVEAYNFASRRQVLALLQGDDSVSADPRRRLNRALFGGLLLGVVSLAATGVAGFLSGGSTSSLPSDGVIVDADTGGAYVRIGNVLHPALNLASAKLVAGHNVTKVSADALRSLPRGLPVGIPGAPDALPPTGDLTRSGWSVCTIPPEASSAQAQVIVSVGVHAPAPLPASSGLLVQTPDQARWLLDDGQRYLVPDDEVARLLHLDEQAPLEVAPDVLDVVPEGPPLKALEITGSGSAPSLTLPFAAQVGDLVQGKSGTSPSGLYVVMPDGIAPVNPFAFALLGAHAPHTLSEPSGLLATVPERSRPNVPQLWPDEALRGPVAPPAADQPFCISYDPHAQHTEAAWPVTFSKPATVPLAAHAAPVAASGATLPTAATGVAVPSGGGALVKAVGSGGVDSVYMLVTDSGLRFSIAGSDAVGRLGYDPATAVPVPLPFVDLLPAGPGLDPTAAAVEYAGAAQAPSATASAPPTGQPS